METAVPDLPLLDEVLAEPPATRVYGRRYAVDKELARGGMGRVYRARDLRIERAVAVTVLEPGQHRECFEQEARAAGALNHPNIVAVFDAGDHAGEPYLVTELLDGETLRAKLDRGALGKNEVLDLALQLADGLAAAHRKGLLHRNLKPENVFITDEGRLKILDFGIAKLPKATDAIRTSDSVVLGTAGYMAPEQVRGETVDARADIVSFGAILYEMLARKPAFVRASAVDSAYAVLHEEPARLADAAVDRIVRRCIAKDPARRYQNVGELAADLRAVATSPRR